MKLCEGGAEMKLRKLVIHNYRSIRHIELEVPDMLVLVGPNNSGKSNILRAIEFGLSTSAKPDPDDFFSFRSDGDSELWVEMTFRDLSDQERQTFGKYLQGDGTIRIRKTAKLEEDGKISVRYNGYIGDVLESDSLLGQRRMSGEVLPDFFLIPAVRDLSDEIKVKNTTLFGRLIQRALEEMAEREEQFMDASDRLRDLVNHLNMRDSLRSLEEKLDSILHHPWGVRVSIEVTPPELERIFELGTRLILDDGVRTPPERKGHGLQRAVIFALVRAWAEALRSSAKPSGEPAAAAARRSSESVFFAIEEPELFLHPHAQRQLAMSLADIAAAPNHQMFISTHSPHFIDLEHYQRIAIVTKPSADQGTQVRQCTRELFEGQDVENRKRRFHMALWINPDRGELFFARKVVLVEGETEKAVLPFLAKKLGCFNPNVSIIDCGSKHNLPLYIEIMNAFKIPYCVIHDEDPLPDPIPSDWREEKKREKQHTYNLNAIIGDMVDKSLGIVEMFCPDFETVAGVSKNQADKKGKALAALEYFDQIGQEKIPDRIREVVRKAYELGG